jgi:hypothetical protein
MPSDERVEQALGALRPVTAAFLSALATMADDIRGYLAAHQGTLEGRAAALAAELGPFGARHIAPGRLAAVLNHEPPTDPLSREAMQRCLETLSALAARGDELFRVRVPEGGDLRDAVAGALAQVGGAFAAARVAQGARSGRPWLGGPGAGPEALPFSRWVRGERRLGPPLLVEVRGSDLRAAGLAEFLDGRQKIVLVVEGDCAPAPLVRLVTPGTFVLQTDDAAGLERLVGWDGPGIAAVVPPGAARFVHDPAAGTAPWQRITVVGLPEAPPRKAVGGLSAAQQAEELELLRTLATAPRGAEAPAAPAAPAAAAAAPPDPADRLADWLLSQADLSDVR